MIENARSSPCWAFRRMPGSGWARDKGRSIARSGGQKSGKSVGARTFPSELRGLRNHALSRHFGRGLDAQQVERCRHEIRELGTFAQFCTLDGDDEGDGIRRM